MSDMSQNQDDISNMLDRLTNSIEQCQKAAENCKSVFSGSTEKVKLPDLTLYLQKCAARRTDGYPLHRKQLIPDGFLNNPRTDLENNDPNATKPDVRNSPHK